MTTSAYAPTAPSKWVDLDGPVHYVDHGGPAGAPLAVLVHGLGGSHANWAPFAELFRFVRVDWRHGRTGRDRSERPLDALHHTGGVEVTRAHHKRVVGHVCGSVITI